MCLLHLHVRIQEFLPSVCVGGGGVAGPGLPDSKKLEQHLLLFLLFLVLTFNLLEGTDPRVRWFFFGKQ